MICFVSFSFLGFAVDTLRQNFFCDVCIPLFIDSIGFVSSTFWQKSSSCSSLQVFLPLPIYECRSGPPHINFFLFKIRPLGRFFTGTFHRENEQVLLKVSSDVEGIGIYVGCYHQVLWSFYSLPCQFCPDMNINCVKKQTRLKISIFFWDWKACHMAPCIHQLYHTPCMYSTSWKLHILLLLCLCLTCFWKPWNICQQCSLKPVFFITVFRIGFLPISCKIYILM